MSNMIDKKFINDCLAPVKVVDKLADEKSKKPLKNFVSSMEKGMIISMGDKKMKTSSPVGTEKYIILSPMLSIVLNYTQKLSDEAFEQRQVASCGLASILRKLPS